MNSACRQPFFDMAPKWSEKRELTGSTSFGHVGLGVSRYLLNHATDEEKRQNRRPEVALLEAARHSHTPEVYSAAFGRWKELVEKNGWLLLEAVTAGPLAVGLGNASPLEMGLTIHHTYGMPVLPGSAVKGLCRRVAARLLAGKKIEQEQFDALFGKLEAAGCFVFHDAWYDPATVEGKPFHRDVVTVHHQKYYGSRGKDAWPTDFDDPVPVPFLVVRPEARFLFAVECPSVEWHGFVGEMLKHALENEGIGGKTNAGYGRFTITNHAQPQPDLSTAATPTPAGEAWENVVVRRNPGTGEMRTERTGRVAFVAGRAAQEIFAALPEWAKDALKDKRRQVIADVRVRAVGNALAITQIIPKGGSQ